MMFLHKSEQQYYSRDILNALLWALKFKDAYTYGHCTRVAYYAKQLAIAAGLGSQEVEIVQYSGLMHDIGKMGIPDAVLKKPERLDNDEQAVMRTHPKIGYEILKPFLSDPVISSLVPGVLCHHERVDGGGYPQGLVGADIPLAAKIILVVDTYDAITTTRVYRPASTDAMAYEEIKKYAGSQFDSTLVELFIQEHQKWPQFTEDDAFFEEIQKKVA